ncbi:MAG TPA: nuclear transport factor 2 family protein [Caulobacteraceae bacterium]|nr:nuclear transport factor 2 family protein [Caulobacteraceae bacterium]
MATVETTVETTLGHDTVDAYIAAWNERDPERRRAHVDRAWAPQGSYVDPHRQAEGTEAISAMIGEAQSHFPGHRITLLGTPEGHGDRLRFSWSLAPEGGAPFFYGTDFAFVGADGRFCDVTGFIDTAPAG